MECSVFVFDLLTLLLSTFASKRCYSSLDHRVCKRLVNVPFAKIDLCRIQNEDKDFVYNVTSVVHGHKHLHRYFSLNPFKPIQLDKRLEKSNCPKNSTICHISEVWTDCFYGNTEDTCTLPTFTADSYGYITKSVLHVSDHVFKVAQGATAVLNTSSGPCYYCRPDSNHMVVPLQSNIFFHCDERIVGVGEPVLSLPPRHDKPTAVFTWNTSIACYQTRRKETCLNSDSKRFCPFHCNTSVKHNIYSFPKKEQNLNLSMRSEEGGKESYSFGFCNGFNEGNCNKDTIICKTISKAPGEEEKKTWVVPVISFKDKIAIIIRPNGYVWRVREGLSRKLKAVVSFNCKRGGNDVFEDVVLDTKGKLVPWFSMSGEGFCAQASPTTRPSTRPSTRPPHSPSNRSSYVQAASIAFLVVVLVAFIFFIKSRPEPPEPQPEEEPGGEQEPLSSSTMPQSPASWSSNNLSATSNSSILSRSSRSQISSPLTVFSEGNLGDTGSSEATERDLLLPKRLKKTRKRGQVKKRDQEPMSSFTTPHSSSSSSSTCQQHRIPRFFQGFLGIKCPLL